MQFQSSSSKWMRAPQFGQLVASTRQLLPPRPTPRAPPRAPRIDRLQWVVDAYILVFAVLILTGAALGDRYGRRRMLVVGLLVFTASSAAGALSRRTSRSSCIARAVQGLGAALLMPLTLTLLSAAFPLERRTAALGLWSSIAGLGVALGPLLGGVLVETLDWHWIFWINVPVGPHRRRARPPPPEREPRRAGAARPARARARERRPARHRVGDHARATPTAGLRPPRSSPTPPASRCSAPSSRRSAARPRRCCRSGSSAGPASRPPTAPASASTSRCSGPSS